MKLRKQLASLTPATQEPGDAVSTREKNQSHNPVNIYVHS